MKIFKSLNFEFATLALLASMAMFYSHESGLDTTVAGYFFNPTDKWIFRDTFVLEKILHKGGVIFLVLALVTLLGRILYLFKFHQNKKKQRDYLGFVFLSSITTIIFVFFLKRWSTLPCPWESLQFGGNVNPPDLWRAFSSDLPRGKCFPSGHSSGGYSFLSMYFGHTAVYKKRNLKTLIPGLIIGVTFGVTQQMRGAHYLSHDFATILISILISWIISLMYSNYNKKYEN